MNRVRSIRFASLASILMLAGAPRIAAQVPGTPPVAPKGNPAEEKTRLMKMAEAYTAGLMYFEGGKYTESIAKLMEFLGMTTEEEKQKTPITFLTLGEAFFRLGKEDNLKKAIATWEEFLKRWPAEPKGLEVRLAIAQTWMALKQWETAITWWKQVESAPALKENSLTGQAFCHRQLKQPEQEITVLEKLVLPDFNTPLSAEGAVRLMSLYALKHDPAQPQSIEFADRAIALLKKLQAKTHLVENFVALNSVAIRLGDELLDVNSHAKALEAYWAVRPRDVVAKMQKDRIAAIELRLEQNLKGAGKDPIALARAMRLNDEMVKPRPEEAKRILAQFEKVPDFMPALYFRMARCFADLNKKWEAIVIFNHVLAKYPQTPWREAITFSRLALYSDLGFAERTYTFADEYLKEFPKGQRAGDVARIKGITAMQAQDWVAAEKHFDAALKILATLPADQKAVHWTEARYQYGNARFLQNKFAAARRDFEGFIAEFGKDAGGKGPFMEEAEYQLALTHLFTGHYQRDPELPGDVEGAIEHLTAWLAKWGEKSNFASDAKYRLAVCRFAASENEQCVTECREWLAKYGKDPREMLQPEVQALLGDALAALKQHAESAAAYIESYRLAKTDQVLNHSLFEAGKQLQKADDWAGVEKLYTEFVTTRPEHPSAVTAMYWMGKAKSKLGRMEEAKTLAIDTLKKHIGLPRTEGIEMILSQIAEWSRRRPPGWTPKPGEPEKWDAMAELERMLKPLRENANATAEARLLYAEGELHKLSRNHQKRAELIGKIADGTKPEDLSPHLLMEAGDHLLSIGAIDKADLYFRALRDNFPQAMNADAAYVGLGEVALARKNPEKAMEEFTYAIENLGAPYKLKEALIGQAKCHIEFGTSGLTAARGSGAQPKAAAFAAAAPAAAAFQATAASAGTDASAKPGAASPAGAGDEFEKARKLFEEVASVREWRGETTAYALFQLGEIQARQNHWKEATALFERVAVTQQRHAKWAARAYLRAADGYYRQGKDDLAKERLREMLANEKFQQLPELDEAKKRLGQIGGAQ